MNSREILIRYKFQIVFFIGLLCGTLFSNLTINTISSQWNIFGSAYLQGYSEVSVSGLVLWQYVIKKRMRDFLLISLLGLTAIGRPVMILFLFYIGMCSGSLISIAVMHYGLLGLLIYLASILPHYIVYFISMFILYRFLFNYRRMRNLDRKTIAVTIAIAAVILLIGTYIEAFLNPIIIKRLYAYIY